MTAKEYFMQVLDAERRIVSLRRQRDHLMDLATGSGAFTTGGVYAHSGEHSRIEAAVVRMMDKEKALAGEMDKYVELVREAQELIARIPDSRQRQVLTLRYLSGMRWDAVATVMNYELRQIFRIHGYALLEAERLMMS